MRDQALPDHVVLVEPEVLRANGERNELLTGWKQPELRDADLDHEAAAWLEVCRHVLETRHLRVLRRQVVDRVEDEIGQRELAVDPRGREIADRDRDFLAAGFLA